MKKYAIISNKKRSELITRVVQNGESVSRVAKQLRMKLPSAKSIIRTYKKSGKIFDKKKIISRRMKNGKLELSETDHQLSSSELKVQSVENLPKEQFLQKEQRMIYSENQKISKEAQKQDVVNVEQMMKNYYCQLYMSQEYAYYYNLLNYFNNPVCTARQFS